jgi:TOMM system kinase/cyclase fusion protein
MSIQRVTTGAEGAVALPIGMTFEERYVITSELGEGGFGTVHKARQLATGQMVAIKLMRPPTHGDAATAERRQARFQREMRLCAQLHHPNIVRLIDSGQTREGAFYSVFEFVPGRTLAQLLAEEGPLAPQEARHLMLQVLDALGCAHAAGVVHRDLKPRNIMVIPTGLRRNALVLDFGIGALTQSVQGEDYAKLTHSEESLGTPGYAAPEQLRGLEPVPQADLFSWGIVFLECLTGKPVFAGGSLSDLLYKQLGPDPIPLPPALEGHPLGDLLRQVLQKDVAQRTITAADVLRQLEACELQGLSRQGFLEGARAGASSESPADEVRSQPGEWHLEEERRQVTLLCCSLGVSAVNGRPQDPEEVDELLRQGQELCAGIARRFRGQLTAALGNLVMLSFGHPRAGEDGAFRAARAALALIGEVRTRGEQLAAQRGLCLEISVGAHTGLVVSGSGRTGAAAHVIGVTPHIAARLSTLTRPGTIAATADTQRLLRAAFDFDDEGQHSLDGLGDAIPVFRLHEERRGTDSAQGSRAQEPPLVGRKQELELLLQRWERARSGAGQSSLVTGEPGIGKSRLMRELSAQLRSKPHSWLECRCSPDTVNVALHPIIELLGRLFELDAKQLPSARTGKLEAMLLRYGCKPAEALPLFAPLLSVPLGERYPPLDVSPERRKALQLNAILSLVFELAEQTPVTFLIEDLHWADPTTLELLAMLVKEAPSAHVHALFTARPEFVPSFPTTGMLQVHLNRLEREEVERLMTGISKSETLPQAMREQILSRTDGVPLFVEELTRMVVEAGALGRPGDEGGPATPLAAIEIPGTLRDSLMARLDRLGRAKETAQIAAALGREFTFEVLAAVSPHGDAAVREDLDRLVAAELVYRKRRLREQSYLFKHALIRDAAYESLPKRSRQKVHALIAKALEERFPQIVEARPDLLAHHHAAADQKQRAIGYAQKAASAALQRSAHAEAIGHTRQALGWLDSFEAPRERAEVELGLNSLLTMGLMSSQGYGSHAVALTVQRSQELIDQLGESPHTVPTSWALFMYHHLQNHREQARSLAERLLALARRTGNVSQEVATLPILGQCFYIEGRLEESRAVLRQAVALYDPGRDRAHAFMYGLDSRAYAQLTLGLVHWLLGEPEQALAQGTAAVAWARELNHATTLGLALLYLVGIHHYQGERDKVRAVTDELVDIVERYGLSMIKSFGGVLRGWADNDVEGANRSIEVLRASGQELGLSYWLSLVAESEAALGRYDDAIARMDECIRYAEAKGELYYVSELYRLKGVWLLKKEPAARELAGACFRQSLDAARRQGTRLSALRSALASCQLLPDERLRAEVGPLLRPLYEGFTEGFSLPELVEARALLAKWA